MWVCAELAGVARAGYVEVPSLFEELSYAIQGAYLGHDHHRWIVDVASDPPGLVFHHKPHAIHADRTLRVLPRCRARMTVDDHLQGLFWEGALPAREEVHVLGAPVGRWWTAVRARLAPSASELASKEGMERGRHLVGLARPRAERLLTRRPSR